MSRMINPGSGFASGTRLMLEAVRTEMLQHEDRLKELKEREKTILHWLSEEEGRPVEATQQPLNLPPGYRIKRVLSGTISLTEFFKDLMTDGKARTNSELASIAVNRGALIADEVDMRRINSTMLALSNAGIVQRKGETWVQS